MKIQYFYRRTPSVPKRCPKSPHEPKMDSKWIQNGPNMGPFFMVFVKIYIENATFLQKDPKGPQDMPQEPP
jgi:hypothetical protein